MIPLQQLKKDNKRLENEVASEWPSKYLDAKTHPTVAAGFAAQKAIIAKHYTSLLTAVSEVYHGISNLVKPLSRGYIEIVSVDQFVAPKANYRVYTHPNNLKIAVVDAR